MNVSFNQATVDFAKLRTTQLKNTGAADSFALLEDKNLYLPQLQAMQKAKASPAQKKELTSALNALANAIKVAEKGAGGSGDVAPALKAQGFDTMMLQNTKVVTGGVDLSFASGGGSVNVKVNYAKGELKASGHYVGDSSKDAYTTPSRDLSRKELSALRTTLLATPSLVGVVKTIESKLAGFTVK
jgi:hypothetical protein